MAFSGGVFTLVAGNPVVTGTTISSTTTNNTLSDIATGLSTCILKDGSQTITANIPMSSFKFTGLGAGNSAGDSLRYEQVFTAGTVTLLGKLQGPTSMLSPIANSLGGNVNLNNTSSFFDGPSVAQGSAGSWFVSGTVTINDSSGSAAFTVILWDGSTVIASCIATSAGASANTSASVSGFITSPAGNLRISVKDATSTNGTMVANASGQSKDSTITAFRIA